MPTYDYICTDCNYKFERFQSMSDEPIRICPSCNGRVRRLIGSGTGLIFKGSGYYLTDYKNKSSSQKTLDKPIKQKETKKTKEKND
ncbi:MAG: zinc ribbon domain-containing protein [Planctomycetia bacterium]|nr:zinc ribbon domain-containing protein [Planctomycetia bacterium]